MILIGIDTGVRTGYAISVDGEFTTIETTKIHRALQYVLSLSYDNEIFVRVEDARKRRWYGTSGKEKLQGAGSIKRDASIWEDFLKDNKIPHEMVAPKNNKTKLSEEVFKRITKWDGRTSEHSRDAAMLIFGYKMNNIHK
jgi:hypothetical protein